MLPGGGGGEAQQGGGVYFDTVCATNKTSNYKKGSIFGSRRVTHMTRLGVQNHCF